MTSNWHHHHLADQSIVHHTHPEDFAHGLRVLATNKEGFAVFATNSPKHPAPECSTRVCPHRRHDDA